MNLNPEGTRRHIRRALAVGATRNEMLQVLKPVWTDEFMAAGVAVYSSGLMAPKLVELLSIAFDASYTHMYAPGTRRHIRAALTLGCSVEEIMDVLKLCLVQGVQACNKGVPTLEEEMATTANARQS